MVSAGGLVFWRDGRGLNRVSFLECILDQGLVLLEVSVSRLSVVGVLSRGLCAEAGEQH